MTESTIAKAAKQLVNQEVFFLASEMIAFLIKHQEGLDGDNQDAINKISFSYDYEASCINKGFILSQDEFGKWGWSDEEEELASSGFESKLKAAKDCCDECGLDLCEVEIYEYWIVSPWLAVKLKDQLESVANVFGLWVWARTTTGQCIACDEQIERIAELNLNLFSK